MKKRLRFIRKKISSPSSTPIPPEIKGEISCAWYRDINDLPLYRFEDCLLNDNLSALVISGFPDEATLKQSWEHIIMQYADELSSDEYRLYMHLYKTVEILNIDIESVSFLISVLRNVRHQYFCDELNSILTTNFAFSPIDQAAYKKDVDRCERRAKAIKIRYDLKAMELENVKAKIEASGGKDIEKGYFTGVLIMLSRHYQYRITKDITMGEYFEMIRQFNLFCENAKI